MTFTRFCRLVALLLAALLQAWPLAAVPLEKIPPAAIVYVEPAVTDSNDIETVTEKGEELLVFKELVPPLQGRAKEVQKALQASPVMDTVLRLYAYSRQTLAELKVPNRGPVALYIYAGDTFGSVGPAHAFRTIRVKRSSGTEETPQGFIILSDIDAGKWRLSVDDLLRQKYLAMTLAHEIGHAMMSDAYTAAVDLRRLSVARTGHDVMAITDPQLALHEGWAEALEALIGDSLADRKVQGWGEQSTDPIVRSMFRGRQDILRADQYIWDKVGARDGETRNGLQMLASEGVIGYQLWQVLTQRDFTGGESLEGFRKVVATMARHRPKELGALMDALARDWPQFRATLTQMLYQWTKWVPYSAEGAELYKKYWVARCAEVRHQVKDDTAKELSSELQEARATYEQFWKKALTAVLARPSIAPALPDPLWVDCRQHRVGLNLATPEQLSDFFSELWGSSPQLLGLAQKIAAQRDSPGGGYFQKPEDLEALVGKTRAADLVRGRSDYLAWLASQDQEQPLAAYLSGHQDRILIGRLGRWRQEATPGQ